MEEQTQQSAEVVVDLVRSRGPKGRCRYNVEAKRELARMCGRPGVSVAKLAMTHGLNANQLRKWVQLYGEARQRGESQRDRTVPVLLPVATMPEVANPDESSAGGCIEIVWAAATVRLRGTVDVKALGAVLDCLAQRA